LADDNNNNSPDQDGLNLPDGSREPLSPQEMDNTDYGLLKGERIQPIDLQQEMRESYLSYALSVIVERALPDVRDGMDRQCSDCNTHPGSAPVGFLSDQAPDAL